MCPAVARHWLGFSFADGENGHRGDGNGACVASVSLRRVNEIVLGRRGISADTALRFAQYFGSTPEVWQNLQSQYEMDVAKNNLWDNIKSTIKPALGRVACL